jgi:hypothetical protein
MTAFPTIEYVPTEDVAPLRDTDTAPIRCAFDGCSNEVVKPARGRTPKFCPEHKANPVKGAATKKASWPKAEAVELALARYLDGFSFVVSMVNPADGQVIASGSGPVAKELVELGRVDKQWRGYLEKITSPGKYGPLVLSLMPITIGIMANHGLLPQFLVQPKTGREES